MRRTKGSLLIFWALVMTLTISPRCIDGFSNRGRSSCIYLRCKCKPTDLDTASPLPADTESHLFLHSPDWKYWFRRRGMQTSTDDVLVSFFASLSSIDSVSLAEDSNHVIDVQKTISIANKHNNKHATTRNVNKYVDLGCGIGSILLMVAHKLQPVTWSVGIEVQAESANIAKHTLRGLPTNAVPPIFVENLDLRMLPSSFKLCEYYGMRAQCDLVTGNPPYCPLGSGTLSTDAQRVNARFEMHGGIEEYCRVAAQLLALEGSFVFSFWSQDHPRVLQALQRASLELASVVKVVGGRASHPKPYLHIYEAQRKTRHNVVTNPHCYTLDITRLPESNKLNPVYYQIQDFLHLCPRPLK